MKYCTYCGKELKEGADVCLHCGKFIKKQTTQTNKTYKTNINQTLIKSIISLVLGIIAIFWTLIMLLGIENGIETLVVEYYYNEGIAYFIGYYIGYTLFALIPSIVSLILGILSQKEKKSPMSLLGIVLSSISLAFSIMILIRFIIVIF